MKNIALILFVSYFTIISYSQKSTRTYFSIYNHNLKTEINITKQENKEQLVLFNSFYYDSINSSGIELRFKDTVKIEDFEYTYKLLLFLQKRVKKFSLLNVKVNRAYINPGGGYFKTKIIGDYFYFSRVYNAPVSAKITNEGMTNEEFIKSGYFWTRHSSRKIIKMFEKSRLEIEAHLKMIEKSQQN